MKIPVPLLVTTALLLTQLSLAACGNQAAVNQSPATSATQASNSSALASSSSPAAKASTQTTQVDVSETEMAIKLSPTTISAGPVNFVVHNNGTVPHEFVVYKTSLPLNQLPLKDGKLDEDNKSLQNVADTGEQKLTSGQTRTLHANLTPGHYVAICNVGNHFRQGMKTILNVK